MLILVPFIQPLLRAKACALEPSNNLHGTRCISNTCSGRTRLEELKEVRVVGQASEGARSGPTNLDPRGHAAAAITHP